MQNIVRVLHFETMPSNSLLVTKALADDNNTFRICVVNSTDTFSAALIDFSPDVVLAGYSPSLFNCYEVSVVFQRNGINIPVIIIVDEADELYALDLLKNGADDYVFNDQLRRLPITIHKALTKTRPEKHLSNFDELVASEKRYRFLIENSTDAVVILNQQGKPTYVSAAVTTVLGYSSEEIMQMDLFSIMHPDDIAATAMVLEKVIENPGVPIKGHTGKMLHKDGSWRWIEANVTNGLNDPAINGIVDNFRDITDAKLLEESYRLLFATSMDGILLTLKNGNVLDANQAACQIFQMSVDEIKNAGRSELVDATDPMLSNLLMEREQNGRAIGELTFKRKDGTKFPGEISSTVFKDAYGSENTSMIIRDISERRRAERKLHESEQFNKSILSSLSAHIAVINESGIIIAVNKAWEDFAMANEVVAMERTSKGANYFEVCAKAISEGITDAGYALAGIMSVFKREAPFFELEYPCHSTTEKRWFSLHVTNFGDDDTRVVVSHQNITALKIFEEKLLLSESRLKQAQAIAKIGSWEADMGTSQLIWSEETYRIFETSHGDFCPTYQTFLAMVHIDDREVVDAAIQSSIRTAGTLHSIEHRIITKNGIEKIVLESWQMTQGAYGKSILASGTCQEITQRKKDEELVKNSRSNLNAIIENTEAFIYSLDRNCNYITFNSRLRESMKNLYGTDIYPGYNIFEFITSFEPGGVQEWREIYSRALAGEIVKFEREFFANDAYTYTSFSINPMWKENTVIGLSCYVHDITDEKQAHDKYKFQAQLLDTIGQAAIATNLEGSVIFWNKAAEEIYGWKANEALNKNILDLTPTNETRAEATKIMATLKAGKTWAGEFEVQRKNGVYFPAAITNSPIYDQHHELSGIIGISSDITEKKALEERLVRTSMLAKIGNYEIDLTNDVISLSPMIKLIFGTKRDFSPNIENTLAFFKKGHYRNAITKAYRRAKENGTDFDLESQIVTAGGQTRWTRLIGQAECNGDKCIRIYGSLQDIDKTKRAELKILQVYEEKNVILESIGDAFFAVDHKWIINYWNSAAEKILGKTRLETQGQNLWDVFSSSIGSKSFLEYHQAVDSNKAVHFEDYYPELNRWYEVSAYPSAHVLSVYIRDITGRRETLAALVESERNYSRLFHLSPLPMWVFDLETLRFLDVNEAAINSYGYSLAEFQNKTIRDIRPNPNSQKLNQVLALPNTPGKQLVSQGIFSHKKKDGTAMQVEIQSNLIVYQGKPAKIVIASDMTERYNYIRSIEEQNTKLREISWMQSHVVRAPLARLMGLIPMIKDTDTSFEERAIFLDYMLIAAKELDLIIKDISDKTR